MLVLGCLLGTQIALDNTQGWSKSIKAADILLGIVKKKKFKVAVFLSWKKKTWKITYKSFLKHHSVAVPELSTLLQVQSY